MKTIIRSLILVLTLSVFVSSCARKKHESRAQQEPAAKALSMSLSKEPAGEDVRSIPAVISSAVSEEDVSAQFKNSSPPACANPSGISVGRSGIAPIREIESACKYLALSHPPAGQSWQSFYARKNKLMSRYTSQGSLPPGFFDLMVGLAADTNTEAVTRAYAIQHITHNLYAGASKDRKQQIEQILGQGAMEHQSLIGGTSLLAAQYLWQKHDAFGKDWLIIAVRQTLADGQADRSTRATALRLAGMLGDEAAVVEQSCSGQSMVGIEAATIKAAWRQLRLPGAPKCESCF